MPRALITGITGQDGSYLSELLLEKGYEVHGFVRRGSGGNVDRRVIQHVGDVCDVASIRLALASVAPDELYHLAAQSHVKASFDEPEYTMQVTALPTQRILECLRSMGLTKTRFYQASSSEMFGNSPSPQNEQTAFGPRSPYAVAKAAAHYTVKVYREAYGMFAVAGILMNHESPRRGEEFVTRKITRAVGRIKHGLQKSLTLGNTEAHRDWGFAGDYVRAMWMMLQAQEPDDYLIATGETHSVREFAECAFARAGLPFRYLEHDDALFRPAEVNRLCGDATKAREKLGWRPSVTFHGLVNMMVDADLRLAGEIKCVR